MYCTVGRQVPPQLGGASARGEGHRDRNALQAWGAVLTAGALLRGHDDHGRRERTAARPCAARRGRSGSAPPEHRPAERRDRTEHAAAGRGRGQAHGARGAHRRRRRGRGAVRTTQSSGSSGHGRARRGPGGCCCRWRRGRGARSWCRGTTAATARRCCCAWSTSARVEGWGVTGGLVA